MTFQENATYFWKPISETGFIACVVLRQVPYVSVLNPDAIFPFLNPQIHSKFRYHRLDLDDESNPSQFCRHFHRVGKLKCIQVSNRLNNVSSEASVLKEILKTKFNNFMKSVSKMELNQLYHLQLEKQKNSRFRSRENWVICCAHNMAMIFDSSNLIFAFYFQKKFIRFDNFALLAYISKAYFFEVIFNSYILSLQIYERYLKDIKRNASIKELLFFELPEAFHKFFIVFDSSSC